MHMQTYAMVMAYMWEEVPRRSTFSKHRWEISHPACSRTETPGGYHSRASGLYAQLPLNEKIPSLMIASLSHSMLVTFGSFGTIARKIWSSRISRYPILIHTLEDQTVSTIYLPFKVWWIVCSAYQEAASVITNTGNLLHCIDLCVVNGANFGNVDQECYEREGGCYSKYAYEYKPGEKPLLILSRFRCLGWPHCFPGFTEYGAIIYPLLKFRNSSTELRMISLLGLRWLEE